MSNLWDVRLGFAFDFDNDWDLSDWLQWHLPDEIESIEVIGDAHRKSV